MPEEAPPREGEKQVAHQGLVQLRARVEEHFIQAVHRSPEQYQCGRGCDGCCHHTSDLTVFDVEAARLRQALADLATEKPQIREQLRRDAGRTIHGPTAAGSPGRACALLLGGRCALYDERPIICRSHGLPTLVSTSDTAGPRRVENCALNFQNSSAETVPRASILDPERINAPLAVIASMWTGSRDGQRISLRALVLDTP